jgi:tetratricopeptide (TPR) repeat protein
VRLSHTWHLRSSALDEVAATFRRGVQTELARLHQEAGNAARAQALIEELTADGEAGASAGLAELAGRVQGLSGARVVEGRLRTAEDPEGDTPAYWRARALYFVGRREAAEADEAFRRALDLAKAANAEGAGGTEPDRSTVADDWVRWLLNSERRDEAFRVARRELEAAATGSAAARAMAHWLLFPGAPPVASDDPLLWRLLLAHDDWRFGDDREMLRRLITEPGGGAGDRLRPEGFERALAASRDAPVGRLLVVAGIAVSCGELERALPLLEDVVRRSEDRLGHPDRTNAERELFHAYGLAGRWRSMEPLVTPAWLEEGPQPLAEAARVAAEAGAHADAIRLWARAINLDRGDTTGLDALVRAGLAADLVHFYERLGEADPACGYVAPILAHLLRPRPDDR